MKIYITLDGGTTNTRLTLVLDGKTVDTLKISRGARSAIDDRAALIKSISEGIKDLLSRNELTESQVERILASGMITSEFGLYKVDHTLAPAGIQKLHDNMREVSLPEVCGIKFIFISGVKTFDGSLENADMMRGEETELMGILRKPYGRSAYVLPGSHSKIIFTDDRGRIERFYTMLTGEMLVALSEGTILKDAVDLYGGETVSDYLIRGCEYAEKHGLNEALFKTRILKNLFGADKDQTYSFFSGAILSAEVKKIASLGVERVLIGGKSEIKEQLRILLSEHCKINTLSLSDEEAANATVNGVIRIYEYK